MIERAGQVATEQCPHGDPTCPCPAGDPCHYEGSDAMACPLLILMDDRSGCRWSLLPFGDRLLIPAGFAHCHLEGCDWHQTTFERDVSGACGLVVKLGLPPIVPATDETAPYYSMAQARPGLPGWPCGWLRTPLNIANREGRG